MVSEQLFVTLDGPGIEESGVLVDGLTATLTGLQDSLRLMVEHLAERQPGPGQPPKWARTQSRLRLVSTRPGSFAAELTLDFAPKARYENRNFGQQAFDAFLKWNGRDDSTLPRPVIDRIRRIANSLPADTRLWLGQPGEFRKVEVMRTERGKSLTPALEIIMVYGRLQEVNWSRRTAQLHNYGGELVKLKFDAKLDAAMRSLATQYVKITGQGRFSNPETWPTVQVEQISAVSQRGQPFDLEGFLNRPNPKLFDPDKVVTVSDPFDVDDFNRVIREGRDVGRDEV